MVIVRLFLLLASLHSGFALALCDLEFSPIRSLKGGRSLESLADAKIGTFNVLNLEFSPGKYVQKGSKRVFEPGIITKDKVQLKRIAKAIKDEKLDLIALQEIEGRASLEAFNKKYLGDAYEVFLQKGNDPRGIEIGFLVKKDLPFNIRFQSHAKRTYLDGDKEKTLFSRDLPALHIRRKTTSMNDPPDFIFAGTHFKSQRSRSGDPRSESLRRRQVEETRAIIEGYEKNYPETPVILAGDFNADLHNSPEFKALFKDDFMKDSFDLTNGLSSSDRITHTYHPREGPTEFNQLDAILVNRRAVGSVKEAKTYRYVDSEGNEIPIPKTYQEREKNPSDHFMVVMKADLKKLFD